MQDQPPTLEYQQRQHPDRSWLVERVLLLFALYPLVFHASLHALYAVEWLTNGERPIAPYHGSSNVVELVLYRSAELLFFGTGPGLFVGCLAWLMHISHMLDQPTFPLRSVLLLGLPPTAWVLSLVLIAWDPLHAMWFFWD